MSHQSPTLMFCVGATKAGTTWLHSQLVRHPECHVRSLKELHYFDGLEHGRLDRQCKDVEARITRLLKRMIDADVEQRVELSRRIEDRGEWQQVLGLGREDTGAYLDYLCRGAETRRLVADMTPAYGLLPEERLTQMAALLPDVRFVYLMRDPVDRLWSHVRMNAHRQGGGSTSLETAHAVFDEVLAGEHPDIARRSDYRAALERLDAAVPDGKSLAMFYEDLFEPGGIDGLCRFLGLTPMEADLTRRVHRGRDMPLNPDAASRARDWLDDQYTYIKTRFGAVPAKWRDREAEV